MENGEHNNRPCLSAAVPALKIELERPLLLLTLLLLTLLLGAAAAVAGPLHAVGERFQTLHFATSTDTISVQDM